MRSLSRGTSKPKTACCATSAWAASPQPRQSSAISRASRSNWRWRRARPEIREASRPAPPGSYTKTGRPAIGPWSDHGARTAVRLDVERALIISRELQACQGLSFAKLPCRMRCSRFRITQVPSRHIAQYGQTLFASCGRSLSPLGHLCRFWHVQQHVRLWTLAV